MVISSVYVSIHYDHIPDSSIHIIVFPYTNHVFPSHIFHIFSSSLSRSAAGSCGGRSKPSASGRRSRRNNVNISCRNTKQRRACRLLVFFLTSFFVYFYVSAISTEGDLVSSARERQADAQLSRQLEVEAVLARLDALEEQRHVLLVCFLCHF